MNTLIILSFFFFQNQVLYALTNPHQCSLLTLIPSEPTLTQFMHIYLKLWVLFNCLKTVSEQISLEILTIKVNWGRIITRGKKKINKQTKINKTQQQTFTEWDINAFSYFFHSFFFFLPALIHWEWATAWQSYHPVKGYASTQ